MRKTLRALALSAAIFASSFLIAVLTVSIGHRGPTVEALSIFLAVGTLVMLVVGATVLVPILSPLARLGAGPKTRSVIASILAVVPLAAVVLMFSDGDDPSNLQGYLSHWLRVPGELAVWLLPYALASAVLGWRIRSDGARAETAV